MRRFIKHRTLFLGIACLGFSSGLPYFLVVSTISLWLAETGMSYLSIGLLSWTSVPYVFKIVFSPCVDTKPLPFLTRHLGQRRSYGLLMQVLIMLLMGFLSTLRPSSDMVMIFVVCFAILLCAALQDVALEAYRIEKTTTQDQGPIASASYFGFRLGMWTSGYVCIMLAEYYSWGFAFQVMAAMMSIGLLALLMMQEHPAPPKEGPSLSRLVTTIQDLSWPTSSLISVLVAIFAFKMGDIFMRSLWSPFFLSMGYSKITIADGEKFIGFLAMLLGGLFGGYLIARLGVRKSFLCWAGLQVLGALLFYGQALMPPSIAYLFVTIGVNQFVGGIGGTSIVSYLSMLCRPPYTGMQYALLSSFGSLSRIVISVIAGCTAHHLSWHHFFLMAALCAGMAGMVLCRPKIYPPA